VREDALPYALAGYGTARHQEIRTLDWLHVDLGAIELAADEEGRKPGVRGAACRWSSRYRPGELDRRWIQIPASHMDTATASRAHPHTVKNRRAIPANPKAMPIQNSAGIHRMPSPA
jgi:hypothetical protein